MGICDRMRLATRRFQSHSKMDITRTHLGSHSLISFSPLLCPVSSQSEPLGCCHEEWHLPPLTQTADTIDRAVIKTAFSVESVMRKVNWEAEHKRFMELAYNRTLRAAERAFTVGTFLTRVMQWLPALRKCGTSGSCSFSGAQS